MKKLLTLLLLAAVLVLGVFAAEGKTVYVSHTAAAGGDGSAAAPYNNLLVSLTALDGEGGTVVLVGDVTVSATFTVPEQTGDLTFTSENGAKLVINSTFELAKNTNDNTVIFDLPYTVGTKGVIFGGFNSVHFTENFTSEDALNFYGGIETIQSQSGTTTDIATFRVDNAKQVTDLAYAITVDGGNFGIFMGGNRRLDSSDYNRYLGAIAAPLTVTINGGTFTSPVTYTPDAALKLEPAFCLSGMSLLSSDATLTVNGGIFNTPIYVYGYVGQTSTRTSAGSAIVNSDPKYYAADGDVTVTLNGGTFNGCEIAVAQTAASYNRLHRGDFTLTIADAAVLADGMVVDATQVKAYAGETATATLTTDKDVTVKRFDVVNGESKTYEEPIRIACIGDSITQGTGAGVFETKAYPAQLYTQAIAAGKDVIVSNYGCGATKVMNYSGLWYNDGLAYTLSMEETDADYIVIGLGTNDAGSVRTSQGQMDQFYEMYTDFVLGYEALPSTKTVFGTSAIFRNGTDLGAMVIRDLQAKVLTEQKAKGENVQYVDLYALTLDKALTGTDKNDNQLLASDLLHPHASGYTHYADKIYGAIFNGVYAVENFEMTELYVDATADKNNPGTKDAPTSNIAVALSKAAENATVYIIGIYEYTKLSDWVAFDTPVHTKHLTIKGVGNDAVLSMNSKMLNINSDLTFDNITVRYSGSTALYITANYNNVTFTETAKTLGTSKAIFSAGYWSFKDDPVASSTLYTSPESISSDKDCTITLDGGSFLYFIGGNLHWGGNKGSVYGTYSGDMTINIGENVVITDYVLNGINGMNYLTGTITANINSWPAGAVIRDYSKITNDSLLAKTYNESLNTGTITVNKGEGVTNEVILTGDFDGDNDIDLADTLYLLKQMVGGMSDFDTMRFYDRNKIELVHVLRSLKKCVE